MARAFKNETSNSKVVPDHIVYYFYLINYWGLGLAVAIFGMCTNILNIVTFLQQNLRDTVNISLLSLAVADFWSLVTVALVGLCFMPNLQALDLPFSPFEFFYVFGWTHVIFTRISSCITAYITCERCLCIAFPLKIKTLITPKRTVLFIIVIYILNVGSLGPAFYTAKYGPVFDSIKNKTIIGLIFSAVKNRNEIETVSFTINNIVPSVTFLSVIIFTAILVKILKNQSEWRKQSTVQSNAEAMSDRDARVVKMVLFISSIFIICYSPGACFFIWADIDTELRVDGKHSDLLYTSFSLLCHLETVNASANIFIYLSLSSKFKASFLQTFCCITKKQ